MAIPLAAPAATIEIVDPPTPVAEPPRRHRRLSSTSEPSTTPWPWRVTRALYRGADWLFGLATLLVGLSLLTAIPFAQVLVLGYLLEVTGRISRTGWMGEGFIGVRLAARLGRFALGCALLWLPLWGLSTLATSAEIINPGGAGPAMWRLGLMIVAGLFVVHISLVALRGGKFRYFFWPFHVVWLIRRLFAGQPILTEARDRLADTIAQLRLPYYFWLGARGFLGAFLWLVIPLLLLGAGHKNPAFGILGGVLLGIVVLYLPFLQARFARDNRLRAFRELGPIRAEFRRAPVAFTLAMLMVLISAMPLYFLKIELIPRDLIFLEGLVFLAFIFPAKLVLGWASARGNRDRGRRFWMIRWACKLLMLPIVVTYVLFVFSSQHIGWRGISSLYEQHAFLLPVPFVNVGE